MDILQDFLNGHDFHSKTKKIITRALVLNQAILKQLNQPYTSFASQLIFSIHPLLHLIQAFSNCLNFVYSLVLFAANIVFPFYILTRFMDSVDLLVATLLESVSGVLSLISFITRTSVTIWTGLYNRPQFEMDDITLMIEDGALMATNLKSLEGSYYRTAYERMKVSKALRDELSFHQEVLNFI